MEVLRLSGQVHLWYEHGHLRHKEPFQLPPNTHRECLSLPLRIPRDAGHEVLEGRQPQCQHELDKGEIHIYRHQLTTLPPIKKIPFAGSAGCSIFKFLYGLQPAQGWVEGVCTFQSSRTQLADDCRPGQWRKWTHVKPLTEYLLGIEVELSNLCKVVQWF